MNVRYRASFAKDLRSIKNKESLNRIKEAVEQVEKAQTQQDIPNLKKLKGGGDYYRIRVGDYRLGLIIDAASVTLVRCLDRKEIYRFFP